MKKKIVIVDIDGTIAKVGDRIKYIEQEPKDWDLFEESCFDDEPIKEMCDLISILMWSYQIVFCTGRREQVREQTKRWLYKNIKVLPKSNTMLLMRNTNDERSDTDVKLDLLHKAGIKHSDIAFVLEDRTKLVEMYRELGIRCLQVDKGDF